MSIRHHMDNNYEGGYQEGQIVLLPVCKGKLIVDNFTNNRENVYVFFNFFLRYLL